MESVAVSLVTAAISLATLCYTLITNYNKASNDALTIMRNDIRDMKDELQAAETRLTECESDRFELRTRIINMEHGKRDK